MSAFKAPSWLSISPAIREAIRNGEPVVALESAVLTHGLPRALNLDLALAMQAEVRRGGAHPATVAILRGALHLGLSDDQLEQLARSEQALKASRRDLGMMAVARVDGGTTVSATLFAAHAAGLAVMATGGIGGVHLGQAGDLSQDLPQLALSPVAVVSSGAKVILDLPRTLEWLETHGVPVLGWQTDEFPAFIATGSGLPLSWRVEGAREAAAMLRAHWRLERAGAVLICVPCPAEKALPWEQIAEVLRQALEQAERAGVRGKQLTPFLLSRLAELSQEASLEANLALLKNNAYLAGTIAAALAA